MNPVPLVFAALRRNLVGSIAVIVLIAIAGALTVIAGAEERAFRAASTRAADRFDLIVGSAGSASQLVLTTVFLQPAALDLLPQAILPELAADPGVESLAPVAVTDSYSGYLIVATSVGFAAQDGLSDGRIPKTPHEALLGADVALQLDARFAPRHGSPAENKLEEHEHAFELHVVGRIARTGTPWDRAIVVPIEAAWEMHDVAVDGDKLGPPWPAARVSAIVVHPRSVSDAYRLRARYRASGTSAVFPAEVLVPLYRTLGDARDLVSTMSAVYASLTLGAVILAMIAALAGQRSSLGVLRALGAPPAFVFVVVWLQGTILIAIGALAAALIGIALVDVASAFVASQTGLAIQAALGLRELALLAIPPLVGSVLVAAASLLVMRKPVSSMLRA
jgi:putative ABC transport system permease protein